MLIAAQYILGTQVEGQDGRLGLIHDLLFDDNSWAVRYVVINTRTWLPGRKVLLAPLEIKQTDWPGHQIKIDKTRTQIEQSPPLSEHEPVSRQRESDLADYFDWPRLWGGADPLGPDTPMGVGADPSSPENEASPTTLAKEPDGDPHLRSCKHILRYELTAEDGQIGDIEDLIVDDREWQIRYLVARVDSVKWITRAHFLIAPDWIRELDWKTRHLSVDLTRDQIESCPEFEPTEPINRRLEERLYDYYGRPRYWDDE